MLGFCFHSLEHSLRLFAAAHHDDALDGIILLVEAEFAQAWSATDGDLADVADTHRHPILRAHDYVADVARIAHQAQAANVIKLAALRIESAAGIGVVDGELLQHGRHRDVVCVEPSRIEQHLVLHHRAPETGIVRDPGNLLVFALDDPIFVDLQLLRRAVRTLEYISIDQP